MVPPHESQGKTTTMDVIRFQVLGRCRESPIETNDFRPQTAVTYCAAFIFGRHIGTSLVEYIKKELNLLEMVSA
jgi:hypothetical protein